MGKTITAFVFVVIKYGENIKELLDYAKNDKDVLECYSITGEYDYILKICAKDIKEKYDCTFSPSSYIIKYKDYLL